MAESPYYVILATSTPLYAPLYLAKQAKLDSIFHRIEFRYGSIRGSARAADPKPGDNDRLVHDVLTNQQCLAGVADPFRALNADRVEEQPFVLSGLIQHMFFWLINGETRLSNEERRNMHRVFEQIVVPPNYMTGYALACHDLMNTCGVQSPEEASRYLFSRTTPGFEEDYYNEFHRKYRKCNFAYITPDVRDFLKKHHAGLVKHDYARETNYKNCLMTGLFVSKPHLEGHRELYDGLQTGINKAVEMIYRDPLEAAWKLRDYHDGYVDFENFDETHQTLSYLARHTAYPTGGKLTAAQIRSAAEIRNSGTNLLPADKDIFDNEVLARFFNVERSGILPLPASSSETIRLGAWVEDALRDVSQEERVTNQSSIRKMIVGIITSLVLLVLDVLLLIGDSHPGMTVLGIRKFWIAFFLLTVLILPLLWDTHSYFGGRIRSISYRTSRVATILILAYLTIWAGLAALRLSAHPTIKWIVWVVALCSSVIVVTYFIFQTRRTKSRKTYRRLKREKGDKAAVEKQLRRLRLPGIKWYEDFVPWLVRPKATNRI